MREFSDLWVCFLDMILNLIIFSIKRGYSGVWGYEKKCVGFSCILFLKLKGRKQKTAPGYPISQGYIVFMIVYIS